ncbi:ATP-binding protein [Oleidesulfovibrio sp.]|uniref:ATP-binding protein n=1 Tax=Oleidesulfovibrio sp. TaxID=2909707 RepID=UPI003A880C0C
MKEIIVISGKGGTGKTTVTAALAATGPAKVLADCDVDAADLHLILKPDVLDTIDFYSGQLASIDPLLCSQCGSCADHCRFDAIRLIEDSVWEVRPEFCEGCGVCLHVCPSQAVGMSERKCGQWYISDTRHGSMVHAALGIGQENSGKLVTTVRRESAVLARKKNVDVLLTDGPPGIGCPVIASMNNADLAVLVTEPSVSALHDLERTIQLAAHFQLPAACVLNKAGVHPQTAEAIRTLCSSHGIPVLAELPYTSDMTKAQLSRQSITEFNPNRWNDVFESLWDAMLNLLDHPAPRHQPLIPAMNQIQG